jgi:hypothetical protein
MSTTCRRSMKIRGAWRFSSGLEALEEPELALKGPGVGRASRHPLPKAVQVFGHPPSQERLSTLILALEKTHSRIFPDMGAADGGAKIPWLVLDASSRSRSDSVTLSRVAHNGNKAGQGGRARLKERAVSDLRALFGSEGIQQPPNYGKFLVLGPILNLG